MLCCIVLYYRCVLLVIISTISTFLQENNIISVHLLGAVMTFACGVAYCWIHSYLTYNSRDNGLNSDATLYARCMIAFFVTIFFIFGILSSS